MHAQRATIARTAVQRAARLVVEAMEPRLLHSADLVGGLAAASPADSLLQPQLQSLHTHASPSSASQTTRQELVLLDTGISGADRLLADLEQQRQTGRVLTVVTFNAQDDALALLGQALQGRHDIAALHIVSHGSDGVLALGSARLDAATLMARAGEVAAWSAALSADADLLLYGCDVAASDSGRQLVRDLATLTGADVAASTDATGALAAGGNWVLEQHSGFVSSTLAFSASMQLDFQGVLARLAYEGFNDGAGNLNGNQGGSGWDKNWGGSSSNLTETATGLSNTGGTLLVSGGSVTASIASSLSTTLAVRDLAAPVGAEGSTTWISFLLRPGRTGLGDYMGLEFGGSAIGFVGYNGTAFGFGRAGDVLSSVVSGVTAQTGQTVLLVMKLQSVAGNDSATLYVNPTPGLTTPNSSFSATLNNLNFGSFTRLGIAAGNGLGRNQAVMDELRVGQTFQDVAPAAAAAAPVISSNGGGASATISVAERSTAVTTVSATDANADTLTYSISGGTDASRFVINSATGDLAFSNAPDYENPRDGNNDNIYNLTVQARDPSGRSDSQNLAVSVSNVDLPALARDDSASTTAGRQVAISVLDNDSPVEGTQLRVVDVAPGANAAAMSIAGSNINYTSLSGFSGTDSFSYRVADGGEGLQHYWNLSGQAEDVITGSEGLLYNGVSTTPGAYGLGLQFDGQNDRAEIADFAYSNSFSLSFWFRMADNDGSSYRYMLAQGATGAANSLNVYFIEKNTNTGTGINNVLRTRLLDGNDADNVSGLDVAATGLADNQWHQYTLTVQSGVGSKVYVDGTLRAAITSGGDAFNPGSNLLLGSSSNTSDTSRYFTGGLDTLQVYNRAVDPAALYAGNLGQAQVDVSVNPGSGAAPSITSNGAGFAASLSVAENTTVVTTVTASDPEGATLSYSLVDFGDSARFSIDPSSGVLRFNSAPDFENPSDFNSNNIYTVVVAASDGSNQDMQVLYISVTDIGGALVVTTPADTVDGNTASVEALLANPGGDGAISLREALLAANASSGTDEIRFNLAGSGAHTIALQAALPTITDTLRIDGSSQPGFAGAPLVALDGAAAGVGASGLVLGAGSSGSVLRGLSLYGFNFSGIEVQAGSQDNLIAGNYIGVDASGLTAPGNGKWGIDLNAAGRGNTIGGSSAADRNVIAGHQVLGAVAINGAPQTLLAGNYIGVGADGSTAQGNTIAYSSAAGLLFASANGLGAVLGNTFHHNAGLAIDLAQDSLVQADDVGDTDSWQNMLVLTTAESTGSQLHLAGQLHSEAGRSVRLEFFANDGPGALGHGEGQQWLGSLDAVVGSNGQLNVDTRLAVDVAAGRWISATVTQLSGTGEPMRTSEFSAARQVAAMNVPPRFTQPGSGADSATLSVAENSSNVAQLGATDPQGLSLVYSISGGADASRFQLDAQTGALTWVQPPDAEAPLDSDGDNRYLLDVTVTNSTGASDTLALQVDVLEDNDNPPVVSAGQGFMVAETAPAGTVVGTLLATDADRGATPLSWALLGGNNSNAFALDAATGRLSVANPAALDVRNGSRFTLTVAVSDGRFSSAAQTLTVDVNNINQAPTAAQALPALQATQDEAGLWVLDAAAFSDPDPGETLSWTLQRTDGAWPAWLQFDAATLTLSGTPGAADVGSLLLQARVSDSAGLQASAEFTLTVADRNDAPQGRDAALTLDEDSTRVLTEADFGFADPLDAVPDSLASVRISGLAGPGLLALRGVAVGVGQEISRADINAGLLSWTPPTDANGDALSRLDFQLRDDGAARRAGSDLDPTPNTLLFNVSPVDDAPVLADQTVSLAENSAAGTSVVLLRAGDADLGSVLRNFSIVSGNSSGAFALDAATGALRVADAAALDFESSTGFTLGVTVSDGLLTSELATLRVNLSDLNEAPAFQGGLGAATAHQGQALSLVLPANAFSDPDAGDTLQWQLRSTTPDASLPAWLQFDAASRTLSGTPTQADVGELLLQVSVTDNAGLSSTTEFQLSVQDLNDAPRVVHPLAPLQAREGQSFSTTLDRTAFGDIDPGDTLQWVVDSPAWLVFDAASLTLSGTPAQADVGSRLLQVTVTDRAGAQASQQVALNVAAMPPVLNNAPQGRDAVLSLPEDGSLVFSAADFGFSDPVDAPGHSLAAVRLVNLPGVGRLELNGEVLNAATEVSVQDINAGRLRYLAPAETSGDNLARFGFQVRDNGGTHFGGQDTDAQVRTLQLDVSAVNDAPVVLRNELDLAGGLSAAPVIVIADPDTPPEQIQIQVGAVSGGQFVLLGSSAGVDSFSLAQVLAGQVRFERDLAEGEPGYQLAVADAGQTGATPVASVGSIRNADLSLPVIDATPLDNTTTTTTPATADPSAANAANATSAASAAKATNSAPAADAGGAEAADATRSTGATRLEPAAAALGDSLLQGGATAAPTLALDTRGTSLNLATPAAADLRLDLNNRPPLLSAGPVADLGLSTLAPLELASLAFGSSNPAADVNALINRLDALRRNLDQPTEARAGELAGGTAMGLSLSVGYVVWLVRGGILASSMLAALPSWQLLDPLPMLGRLGNPDDDEEAERDQVENLFAKGHGAPVPPPVPDKNEEPAA